MGARGGRGSRKNPPSSYSPWPTGPEENFLNKCRGDFAIEGRRENLSRNCTENLWAGSRIGRGREEGGLGGLGGRGGGASPRPPVRRSNTSLLCPEHDPGPLWRILRPITQAPTAP